MRYNPYGISLWVENTRSDCKLSTVKKWPLIDPVRVVVIVMAVLSTNCILGDRYPQTNTRPCVIDMPSEYVFWTVGEVSGLTALPEVTGIVTSSLFRRFPTVR